MSIKKDMFLRDFLSHPLLQNKYELKASDIPKSCSEALKSEHKIIRGIATICDELMDKPTVSVNSLYETMAKRLNRDE